MDVKQPDSEKRITIGSSNDSIREAYMKWGKS